MTHSFNSIWLLNHLQIFFRLKIYFTTYLVLIINILEHITQHRSFFNNKLIVDCINLKTFIVFSQALFKPRIWSRAFFLCCCYNRNAVIEHFCKIGTNVSQITFYEQVQIFQAQNYVQLILLEARILPKFKLYTIWYGFLDSFKYFLIAFVCMSFS